MKESLRNLRGKENETVCLSVGRVPVCRRRLCRRERLRGGRRQSGNGGSAYPSGRNRRARILSGLPLSQQ